MAQNVGTVNVQLNANTATFVTGMSKAAYAAKTAGSDIRKAFANLGDVASVALAPFGQISVIAGEAFKSIGSLAQNAAKQFPELANAVGGIAVGFAVTGAAALVAGVAFGKLAIDGADAIERLVIISQKTGIAARDLQVFEAAGMIVDVSLEDMVTGMRKFDQALTGTSKQSAIAKVALHELGVTSKDPKEALLQVADAISQMDDGAVKGAILLALFGKSGLAMLPLMNQGREGIERAGATVERFGATITKEGIASTEKWKQSTVNLSQAWDSMKVSAVNFLPILTESSNAIAGIVKAIAELIEMPSATALANGAVLHRIDDQQKSAPTGINGTGFEEYGKLIAANKKREEDAYDVLKAGGQAAYALEQKKLEIQGKELIQKFTEAGILLKQIPSLERIIELEKEAAKEAEKRARIHGDLQEALARQSAGLIKPLFELGRGAALTQAASGPAPGAELDEGALAAISESTRKVLSGSIIEGTESGQNALKSFYDTWQGENKKAIDVIEGKYQEQMKEFQGFLALGEISQKQFADVSVALEQERVKKIIKSRDEEMRTWDEEALKFGTFKDKFHALTNELQLDGQELGGKIFESFHKAIDDLSSKLAELVVTGKANFKELFTSLSESIVKSGLQSLFGQAAKGISSKLGFSIPGLGGKKPTGAAGDPLYVAFDTGAVGMKGLGGLFGGKSVGTGPIGSAEDAGFGFGGDSGAGGSISSFLSSFTTKLSSMFTSISSSISSVLSNIGGGISSGISGIGSLFSSLAFLAGGGSVTPGHAYIVGEKHPEFFVPRQAGQVTPALAMGGGNHFSPTIHFVVNTPDANSFKKSQGQIMGDLLHQMALAHSRNH